MTGNDQSGKSLYMGTRPYKEGERKSLIQFMTSSWIIYSRIILKVTLKVIKNSFWACQMGEGRDNARYQSVKEGFRWLYVRCGTMINDKYVGAFGI